MTSQNCLKPLLKRATAYVAGVKLANLSHGKSLVGLNQSVLICFGLACLLSLNLRKMSSAILALCLVLGAAVLSRLSLRDHVGTELLNYRQCCAGFLGSPNPSLEGWTLCSLAELCLLQSEGSCVVCALAMVLAAQAIFKYPRLALGTG